MTRPVLRRGSKALSRSVRSKVEPLESRLLLSGTHDQQLLAAISSALHPATAALAQFNSRLTDATELGRSLPLVGSALNSFDPGAQLTSVLSRINSGYTSLTQLAAAIEGAAGAADGALVSATRDLPDDLEIDVQFSASATKSLPISAKFGTDFSVSGTVNVATTLSESLSVGAYWDPSTSLPAFYVSAPNTHVQVSSSVTGTTLAASAHLGFIDLNVSAGSAVFSPQFTFALTDPSPDGPAGRVTTAELTTAPLSSLVSASLSTAAPTSLTASISTSLAPTAASVTFTWADINDPSSVSSNLNTDSALASLSNLENISPSTISAGLQLLVGDLSSAASGGPVASALNTKLPLINKSINDVVNFPQFFKTYLTNYTDPTFDASGAAIEPFTTGNGLLNLLKGIPGVGAANAIMQAAGTKLTYTLTLPETINASFPLALNVGSAINLNVNGSVNLSLATQTKLTFGVDSSTGVFFINAPSQPVFTANATLSATINGSASIGFIGVSVTNGTVSTTGSASISLVDPQLDSPATPNVITSTELSSANLPSISSLASVALTGTASASFPVSTTVAGINPQTLSLSWPDINAPSSFNLNTAALSQFLDFNQLSFDSVLGYLKQLPTFLTNLAGSSGIGKDIAFVGSSVGKAMTIANTLQGYLNTLGTINTVQDLQTALGNKLGAGNLGLNLTGDEMDFTVKMNQTYSTTANWSFGTSFGGGLVSLQSSGTVPISGSFNAQLKFGINLSPTLNGQTITGNPADRFFIVSASPANLSAGSSISGGFNVNGSGINATGTIAFATIGVAGGTVNVAGTDGSGNIVPASNATLSLVIGDGVAGDKLTLTQLLANPSSLFGPLSFNGAAKVVLPLTGLPAAAGAHPQVELDWTNLSDPSTISVTPNFDPATLNPLANFNASTFFDGITSVISLVQQWSSQPILQTNIPFINKPISAVIDFAADVSSVLQKIKDSGANSPSALESAVLNSPQLAGFTSALAEIQTGVNDDIANAKFDYVLKFHDNLANVNFPFDWGNSLFSLNGNVAANVNFTTSIEFGFNKNDGFYIVGNNNTAQPQVGLSGSVTGTFDHIGGNFGPFAYGVSNGSANISFNLGLNLSESSVSGTKMSATDLITNAASVMHPFATGSGNLSLPIGFRLGTTGPAVTTTFTASWDPNRNNALGFGPNDTSDPTDGFGPVNYDIGEFVNGIIGPVLSDIQEFNPIPQSVLDTLNAKIPVINKSAGDILGDYLNNPGLKLLFKISDAIGGLPSATPGHVNLSSYIPGESNTGDSGGPLGGVPPAGDPNGTPTSGNFGLFKSFSQTLKNDFYLSLPVLDNPSGSIIKILTGKDVDLVQFNPGLVSLTQGYQLPEISVPIASLGVVSVNAFISGGVSATLFANINLGLNTRGLRGEEIGGGGSNIVDGFYVDDTAQYQAGINLSANLKLGGSVSVFGYDAVQLYGQFTAFGQFGVHVNDVAYNATTHLPIGIANYAGNPAGDNRAYLDEISYIANNFGPLCAIMPLGQLGLNVGLAGKVNFVLGSITLFNVSSTIVLADYNYPCVPVLASLASIQGTQLVMNTDAATDGKSFTAAMQLDPNTAQPIAVRITETNGNLIYYQDFTLAQLSSAGVNTFVFNGSAGPDRFKIDPNITQQSTIKNFVINTGNGNDSVDLTNLTPANSSLQGVTINGGNGNDTIKGTYAPEVITLGGGTNTLFTGTGPALVTEGGGTDTVTSGDGNVTVNGGSGTEHILLGNGNNVVNAGGGPDTIDAGDGNNVINAGSGAEQIQLGNGKNLVNAGSGTDTVTAGDGDNKIFGDNGGSVITVGAGQDVIFGGTGNDSITANGGNDFINPGGGTNVVNGGTGNTLLEISGNGNQVLTSNSVTVSGVGSTTFSNVATIALTGGAGNNSFDISGWTGGPAQITGGGGTDSVISTNDTDFTLSDGGLARADGARFSLTGITAANLTGGPSDNAFDLTGWHGTATLAGVGGVDQLTVGNVIGGVLSNSSFTRSGAGAASLNSISRAQLTTSAGGTTSINASGFSGDVALFGQGGGNSLTGGTGSNYIVGGAGSNTLVGNGTTNNQLIGGSGSGDTIFGGPAVNLLIGSSGGFDTVTSGSGSTRVYTPGGHVTVHAESGHTIVYAGETGDSVLTGSSTTDQVVHPGDVGTVATDFVAPAADLWQFPVLAGASTATLPSGADSQGQWVEYGSSASGGGVSSSTGSAIEPATVSTGSGASAIQYVAWADNRTGISEIYVARHANGAWQELAGSAHGQGISGALGGRRPTIALDGSGNPIVAWTQVNGASTDIEVAHYDPTANGGTGGWVAYGTSLGAGGVSNTGKADSAKAVSTAAGPVVSWLDSTSGFANVYVARFSGGVWSALGSGAMSGTGISASASSSVQGLTLATDGTKVAAAWTQGVGGSTSIYLAQFNGSSWAAVDGSESATGLSGAGAASQPSIAYFGGNLYSVFVQISGGTNNVKAMVAGASNWAAVTIDTPISAGNNQVSRGAASSPVLATSGSAMHLVWVEDRLNATPDQAVAIYANRFAGSAFTRQLPGDASLDGILGRSTSLSSATGLALAVDGAGHPFVAWGDTSSGASQVYALSDTLDVTKIIYVNDKHAASDVYTTADGASSNDGLTPATPLDSLQAALNLAGIAAGTVILVDGGTYAGNITLSSADNGVLILGSPGAPNVISGAVALNAVQNVTLQNLTLSGGATVTGGNHLEFNNDRGGTPNQIAANTGGSLTLSSSNNVTVEHSSFNGLTLSNTNFATSLLYSKVTGPGVAVNGPASSLLISGDALSKVTLASTAAGTITNNNISGGGLVISAAFTGPIQQNLIHGAAVGVTYAAAAMLNGNRIFANTVGANDTVNSATTGLGFVAGSTPNQIIGNSVGVTLTGLMQGQHVAFNGVGVSGSGVLGGTSLDTANLIEANGVGAQFNGTMQYERFSRNGRSIAVQSGQLIDHDVFYNNVGANLETLGASDVRIINDTFYSATGTNVLVDNGSSAVQVLNSIMWTAGGYDLSVDNASRGGFFSDYNDLYSTGSGKLVHWLVDFTDVLDWQNALYRFDLHSIGTTAVNPTGAQPQFIDAALGDFRVFGAAAGIRATSPTADTGSPITDLGLPPSYVNQLTNPSFESGLTGWSTNAGATTGTFTPGAFLGSSFYFSGNVGSGFAQQTVSLTGAGFTAGQLDAQNLVVTFGGRIRSAVESPVDQGTLTLTFLDGSSNPIGTPDVLSATNASDRWELVGDRVNVPAGARSVVYKFSTLREAGTNDDSYLDGAFLYVLSDSVAGSMGAFGNTAAELASPAGEHIQLESPDLYVNWELNKPHQILWSTFGNDGGSPVKIDLYQDVGGVPTFLMNIVASTVDTGSYTWIPANSGLSYGTYGLRIQVSVVGQAAVRDRGTETFTIPENGTTFYINDGSTSGDEYTTAVGNNRVTGKLASAPLPLLTTLFREYSLDATSSVFVDTGNYNHFAAVEISGNPAIGSGQGVTITGAVNHTSSITALGFTSPAVFDINAGSFVTLSHVSVTGGDYGFWVHNGSTNFNGSFLTAATNGLGGLRLEADAANSQLDHISAINNSGDGIYSGAALVNLTNSTATGNTGAGFDLANAGSVVMTGNVASGNHEGLIVLQNTAGATAVIGTTTFAAGQGNQFFNNVVNGIRVTGGTGVIVAGNTVYGQTATGSTGILAQGGGTVTGNVVYNNYEGIRDSNGLVSNNRVYSNTDIGIQTDSGGTTIGNVSYNNGVGIKINDQSNTSTVRNNLLYNNSAQGIWIIGGLNTQVVNNTSYQSAGAALRVDAFNFGSNSNLTIENNVFWAQSGAVDVIIPTNYEVGLHSDYNDLYVTGTGILGNWENVNRTTLQAWQFATVQDVHSISVDPLFVNVAGTDFHEQSTTGSFHGGSIAPILGGNNLPATNPGTLTADAGESPAIDRGDAAYAFANEPAPNGGYINLGAFGNMSQASESPTSYVLVLAPATGGSIVEGQNFTITWRSQDTGGTVNIDLLQQGNPTPVLAIAAGAANNGSYSWSVPTNLAAGTNYIIRVTRNTAAASGSTGLFTISGQTHIYYVNDGSFGAGDLTTAAGSDANTGLTVNDPMGSVQGVLAKYTLGAGDVIEVDRGIYNISTNIVISAADAGVTIQGYVSPTQTGQWTASVAASAPASYYRLNDASGTTATDSSGNNVNGTYVGGVALGQPGALGIGDTSAGFNGGNWVQLPSGQASFAGGFSFEAWAFQMANAFYAPLFDMSSNGTANELTLRRSANTTDLALMGSYGSVTASGILQTNVWQYLAVTISGAGAVTIYCNGSAVGSGTITLPTNIARPNSFIGHNISTNLANFVGRIQEAAFFNREETAAEIMARYQLAATQPIFSRGNRAGGADVFDVQGNNVTLDHLTMTNADIGVNVASNITGVKITNNDISQMGDDGIVLASGDNGSLIDHNAIHGIGGFGGGGINVNSSLFTISNNSIFNCNNAAINGNNSQSSLITGNSIFNNSIGVNVNAIQIAQNQIFGNSNYGINANAGVVATGNTVFNNGGGGNINAGIWLQQGLATGNVIYGNVWGILASNQLGTANNNLVYGNTSGGIQADNDTFFNGNVVYGNTGYGIFVNITQGNLSGGALTNNVVYGNTTGGILVQGAQTFLIQNNTVYQTAGDAVNVTAAFSGLSLRDNIFWSTVGADLRISAAAQAAVSADYNDLYVTGTAIVGVSNSVNYATLGAWSDATGFDVNSISIDPLFVDLANKDFHEQSVTGSFHGGSLAPVLSGTTNLPISATATLTADANESPAIDAGNPSDAFNLEPVPNGGYDNLGAYGNTAQASLSPTHYLNVLYPHAGQTWATGQTFSVQWRSQDHAGTVEIDLLDSSNALVSVVAAAATNSGSFSWNISPALVSGNYSVRITRSDGNGVGTSASFAIAGSTGVYYVNDGTVLAGDWTTAPGSNSNTGLDPAHPKASIAAILAAYQLSPGNIIMVDNGSYTLTANVTLPAADSGIIIEGFTGTLPVLNRNNTNGGAYAFGLTGATNVTIQNFEITNAYAGVFVNDNSGSTGLAVHGLNIHNVNQYGIYIGPADTGGVIDSNTIQQGQYGIYANSTTATISNNTIFNFVTAGVYFTQAGNSTISGNTIHNGDLGIFADHVTITGNTIFATKTDGLYVNTATVTGNTISGVGGGNNPQAGIFMQSTTASNNVIFGCFVGIAAGNTGLALNNRVFNCQTGIQATAGSTAIGNIVYSNTNGIFTQGGTTISGNLIYANTNYGLNITGGNTNPIIGNTIYQPTGDGIQVLTQTFVVPSSIYLRDNIVWTQSGRDVYVDASQVGAFSSDYNDFYVTGTGKVGVLAGQTFNTLAAWTTELSLDANSISVDPLFVSILGADGLLGFSGGVDHGTDDNFNLQSGSPGIDTGDPSQPSYLEPMPNGGRVNLGYTGNTSSATLSPTKTVQVLYPNGLNRLEQGHTYNVSFRSTGVATSQLVMQVNAGGGTVGSWLADSFALNSPQTGTLFLAVNTTGLANPAPAAVYNDYTSAPSGVGQTLTYKFPVAAGTYTINLEFDDPNAAVGQRKFNILAQGNLMVSNYDIVAGSGAAGKATRVTLSNIVATGTNGITVQLVNQTSLPAILSGASLAVVNSGGVASPTAHVELSTDNGATWSSIATNVPIDSLGNGTFAWTPNLTTNNAASALLRVTADQGGSPIGISAQPFMIANGGTSFYVNDGSLTGDSLVTAVGNNANDGKSPNTPMSSIAAIINSYHPGAGYTIFVENGTYTPFQNINIFASDSGLTIQGPTGGGTATLNRGDVSYPIFSFVQDGAHNVTFDHLSLTGGSIAILAPDLTAGTAIGITNVTVTNSTIFGNPDVGIYIGQKDVGWLVNKNSIHDNDGGNGARQDGIFVNNASAAITNNTIFNQSGTGILVQTNVGGTVISGNTVFASAVGINASNSTVSGNLVHDNTSTGIQVNNGTLASGNTVWRQTAGGAAGFQIAGGEIRGNAVYGNYNGIYLRNSSNSIVDNNRVYSNTNLGMLVSNGGGDRIFNNLVYANANGGIFLNGTFSAEQIINNTVYQPVNDAINLVSSPNDVIENNILWVEAGYDIDVTSTASQSGQVSDYNVLHTGVGASARVGFWNGAAQTTLSNWTTASAKDTHSTGADPLFVSTFGADGVQGYNPTANNGNGYDGGADDNFLLLAGSPAIHAGNNAVAPATDLLGQTRPTPVDIGAYAFTGSITDTTPPTITGTNPTAIDASGQLSTLSSITVNFSEAVNPVDAGAVAEYDLRAAGPDSIFNTADDVIYVINPAYTPGATSVLLSFTGAPLPQGTYRLTIFSGGTATIHDLAGLGLDGDNNGTAGGAYVRTFTISTASPVTLTTPVQYIKLDADGVHIDVYTNATGTGTPSQQLLKSNVSTLTVTQTGAATTPFIVDFSAGNPLPATGLSFTGNGTAGFRVIGSATANDTLTFGSAQLTFDGSVISLTTPGRVGIQPGTGNDAITINSGTFTIAASASATAPTVMNLSSLTIAGGGAKLDLSNNELLVGGSSIGAIAAYVQNGQIVTTSASQAVGFAGGPGGTVEVRATLFGDTNLDGAVDVTDLGSLASSYGLASGATWLQGDFDHNGAIDVTDLGDLASFYGQTLGGIGAGDGGGDTASPLVAVAASAVGRAPSALPTQMGVASTNGNESAVAESDAMDSLGRKKHVSGHRCIEDLIG